jgi:cytochrome c5
MSRFHDIVRRAGAALAAMMLPAAAAAQAETGQALFETRCARCHADPAGLKTAPARVAAALRGVRQHRFTLSDAELKALTDYLAAARPRP